VTKYISVWLLLKIFKEFFDINISDISLIRKISEILKMLTGNITFKADM